MGQTNPTRVKPNQAISRLFTKLGKLGSRRQGRCYSNPGPLAASSPPLRQGSRTKSEASGVLVSTLRSFTHSHTRAPHWGNRERRMERLR